jgi:acetyltransferase-like isoleucine patch superfamily enzyme
MNNALSEELLSKFSADGNKLINNNSVKFLGKFGLQWRGHGSTLSIGDNVTISNGSIKFQPGGGEIYIGSNCTVKGNLEVSEGGIIIIGDSTFINRISDIRAGEGAKIEIGMKCLFSNVKILTSDMHSIIDISTKLRTNPAKGIVIEDEVWLAEDTKVSKGVRIGKGSIISSGSLVTKSIAPYSLAVGRPAKVVRTGVTWTRKLQKMPATEAPEFEPDEISLNKEILKHLAKQKKYALIDAVISRHSYEGLPAFALWYLFLSKYKMGVIMKNYKEILDTVLRSHPKHEGALKMRSVLRDNGGKS